MKFKLKKQGQGFTIVELLIVIVVIGLLAALVIVQFSNVQARARDSERKSDIRAIQSKVAEYYALNGRYPSSLDDAVNDPDLGLPVEACKAPSTADDCTTALATRAYKYKTFLNATAQPADTQAAYEAAVADGTNTDAGKYVLYTTTMETGGVTYYRVSSN